MKKDGFFLSLSLSFFLSFRSLFLVLFVLNIFLFLFLFFLAVVHSLSSLSSLRSTSLRVAGVFLTFLPSSSYFPSLSWFLIVFFFVIFSTCSFSFRFFFGFCSFCRMRRRSEGPDRQTQAIDIHLDPVALVVEHSKTPLRNKKTISARSNSIEPQSIPVKPSKHCTTR